MKYLQSTTVLERGILTSSYKKEIKNSIAREKGKSISKIKSFVFNHQTRQESQTAVILQVSLFVFALVMISI
ncbi:hypothetical protein [Polaribacter sp. KT 15]|uniref:hypothetical protein n=1 Tax=unclassified Polaribacter TaxID=196858 RepID=UPI00090BADFB|nr:hypothetical protein [Polaribacter sp. KT 15]SHM79868.1 hypothetical protein SAMN05720268_0602 [Polaribacter sp. KT 15]